MLDERAMYHSAQPAFWIPNDGNTWDPVTYSQHHANVRGAKKIYKSLLSQIVPLDAVVGIRYVPAVSGRCVKLNFNRPSKTYTDFVRILAVAAAGYIPHLLSPDAPNSVVFKLVEASGARVLLADNPATLAECPVRVIGTMDVKFDTTFAAFEPLGQDKPFCEIQDMIAVIVHSSGSTNTTPKLIPWTNSWISAVFARFKDTMLPYPSETRNEVGTPSISSFQKVDTVAQVFSCIDGFSNGAVVREYSCQESACFLTKLLRIFWMHLVWRKSCGTIRVIQFHHRRASQSH